VNERLFYSLSRLRERGRKLNPIVGGRVLTGDRMALAPLGLGRAFGAGSSERLVRTVRTFSVLAAGLQLTKTTTAGGLASQPALMHENGAADPPDRPSVGV
jgi:hypothetical protein